MAKTELTSDARARFKAARAQGEALAQDASTLVDARYERASDAFVLTFRGGGSMRLPRRLIPGLEHRSAAALSALKISPAGDALLWPSIDADVYVPGLVERAFGTRMFAASAGRRGGRRRTKAKVAAARLNGAKGGRPRKDSTSRVRSKAQDRLR